MTCERAYAASTKTPTPKCVPNPSQFVGHNIATILCAFVLTVDTRLASARHFAKSHAVRLEHALYVIVFARRHFVAHDIFMLHTTRGIVSMSLYAFEEHRTHHPPPATIAQPPTTARHVWRGRNCALPLRHINMTHKSLNNLINFNGTN